MCLPLHPRWNSWRLCCCLHVGLAKNSMIIYNVNLCVILFLNVWIAFSFHEIGRKLLWRVWNVMVDYWPENPEQLLWDFHQYLQVANHNLKVSFCFSGFIKFCCGIWFSKVKNSPQIGQYFHFHHFQMGCNICQFTNL